MTYSEFRTDLLVEIITSNLTPANVANRLEAMAETFPQIDYAEIYRFRQMGETWQAYQ